MNKSLVIIMSTVIFSLIGLLVGFIAIRHLTESYQHDNNVIVMAILPTFGGAAFGFAVGYVAIKSRS